MTDRYMETKAGDVFVEVDPYRLQHSFKPRTGRRPRLVCVERVEQYSVLARVTSGRGVGKTLSIPRKHLGVHWTPAT